MDLVASLVNSLAWPVSAAVMVFILRRSILKFMHRIGDQLPRATKVNVDAGPWKFAMEMAEQIREEQDEAGAVEEDAPEVGVEEFESQVQRILSISPSAAVVFAGAHVENALRDAYRRSNIPVTFRGTAPFGRMTRDLLDAGLISDTVAEGLNVVKNLRNTAAHTREPIGRVDAAAIIPLAIQLERVLNTVSTEQTDQNG